MRKQEFVIGFFVLRIPNNLVFLSRTTRFGVDVVSISGRNVEFSGFEVSIRLLFHAFSVNIW